jgi:hypothetical protein
VSGRRVYKPLRGPWFLATTTAGRLFQLWMLVFLAATGSIVTSLLPLSGRWLGVPAPMAALYALEAVTIAVLALTYRFHWAPRARAADERVRELPRQ